MRGERLYIYFIEKTEHFFDLLRARLMELILISLKYFLEFIACESLVGIIQQHYTN